MAYNLRIFGFRGIQQLPLVLPRQYSADSVFQLVYPYEFSQLLVINGATPVSSSPTAAPDATQLLRIEVPDGQSIRYEVNSPGRTTAAGTQSPIMSGINQLYFRQGWVLSAVDAASFP